MTGICDWYGKMNKKIKKKNRKHVTSHLFSSAKIAPHLTFSVIALLLINLYLCMNLIMLANRPLVSSQLALQMRLYSLKGYECFEIKCKSYF